ncbi:hypothetical protein J6590_086691 [Homalodisca vitripennis]|nr:hypothetical protein J6590_086691 [Homalodisca vitripennis]
MSDRSVRRILHKDLFFHPYKIMLVQKLDFQHRVNCAQEILERIPPRSTFFSSDEAHFHLSDDDFLCSSVTDRKMPDNETAPSVSFGASFSNQEPEMIIASGSNDVFSVVAGMSEQSSPSHLPPNRDSIAEQILLSRRTITTEEVQPYPKAHARKINRRGRKPGRT